MLKMNRLVSSFAAFGIAAMAATSALAMDKDIVDTAAGNSDFSTLVAAVQAAGLVETLKGPGPFTVFAPTNEAFAALGGEVDNLLKPENKDKLTKVLTYHVVAGKVMSTDLTEGMMAASVEGGELAISLKDGATVNGAKVIQADIETSNGVIHVIDTVLLPKDM
jgi:uncharacterized surface protein with fasciclin (FAS1) repeats